MSPAGTRPERWSRPQTAVAIAVALASGLKIYLASTTFGTNDIATWEGFLHVYRRAGGIGLYREVPLFIHPPFIIHFLRVVDVMASVTHLPFPLMFRLAAIAADAGSVWLTWKIVAADDDPKAWAWKFILLAVAPASIMISGFHGNTDPIMIFFVLLTIYCLQRQVRVGVAGAAFGMALSIKVAAVLFLPALVLSLPVARRRVRFIVGAGAAWVFVSLPYIARDPVFIARRLVGYKSAYGHWGISRLLAAAVLPQQNVPGAYFARGTVNVLYMMYGGLLVLLLVGAGAFVLNRRENPPSVFVQCGITAFAFMTLTPGFGVQYLAWLVPWVVALGIDSELLFHVTTGLFLFFVYTYWSGGVHWYFANSWANGDWRGYIVYFELLAWSTIAGIWLIQLKKLARSFAPVRFTQLRDAVSTDVSG